MPRPGDFGVVVTGLDGNLRDRFFPAAIRFFTHSDVNHAVIFEGDVPGYAKPQVLEARPSGAGRADWDSYPVAWWSTNALPEGKNPTDAEREQIVYFAREFIGTGYGFADIFAIWLAQERMGEIVNPLDPPWWYKRIESTKTLICSQYVDLMHAMAGVHLFTDGRPPGLVSPGNLRSLLINPQETRRYG